MRFPKHAGLTLVEIMITLVIVATVLGIAAINLGGDTQKKQLTKTVNALYLTLQKAQSEAIRTSKWACVRLHIGTTVANAAYPDVLIDENDNHDTQFPESGCRVSEGDPIVYEVKVRSKLHKHQTKQLLWQCHT